MDQSGHLDVPPDRQDATGPRVDALLDHLNHHVRGAWHERAAELLRNGVMHTRRAGEFTLYQDSTVVIKGNTDAKTFGSQFLDNEDHYDQLRRCLNDDSLPLDVRIVGALVRLYALQLSRITTLTTDRFHTADGASYLTLDRHPVVLPPKLGQLIQNQIDSPVRVSLIGASGQDGPGFLLPGRPAHRPRNVEAIRARLRKHGLPNLTARNTAMIEAVSELPPIVVSDLFGVAAGTAHKWAQFAQDSWADYLTACQAKE